MIESIISWLIRFIFVALKIGECIILNNEIVKMVDITKLNCDYWYRNERLCLMLFIPYIYSKIIYFIDLLLIVLILRGKRWSLCIDTFFSKISILLYCYIIIEHYELICGPFYASMVCSRSSIKFINIGLDLIYNE